MKNTPLRIAFVLPGFSAHPDDWAIPALQNLATTLAQSHSVAVFSQRHPAQGFYQWAGLTHYALGAGQKFGPKSPKLWLQTAWAIVKQHKKTPFDLLHAFWVDEAGFSAALAGAIIKRPVVASLGGWELTYIPAIKYGAQHFLTRRLTVKFALRRASRVTAGSNYQLDLCREHQVPEHKLCLAPLGVDTEYFRPPNPDNRSSLPPSLVQVASLVPVKNQALLCRVLSLVKANIPNIRLNLAGSGPLQAELVTLVQKLELADHILWHQQVAHQTLPRLYQQSHLYLQTSWHESQGLAVLEAMACGVPVLGTPVGVVRDVACLPAQESVAGLAAQVSQVLRDQSHYLERSSQARRVVEQEFSLPVVSRNFLDIYQHCLS